MSSHLTQLEKRIAELEVLAEMVVALARNFAAGNQPGDLPTKGEEWYRGARSLLVTHQFSGLPEFDLCYRSSVTLLGKTEPVSWSIESFIHSMNANKMYLATTLPFFLQTFGKARALLRACVSEVKSRELPITTELSFAVSQDEFETAENLLDSSNEESIIRASGVVARVALERHLLVVAESRAIQIPKNPPHKPKIDVSDILNALRKDNVITSIQKSELDSLFTVGNHCAHPSETVTVADVERLIQRGKELASVIL
jgi:Domain of unknown function (DUF4145)